MASPATRAAMSQGISSMSIVTRLLEKYFYFSMALLIPVIVVYGFSFTIGQNLLHPAIPRPRLLYVHAAVFSGWVILFILQTALVRVRKVSLHRAIGLFGLAHGITIVLVGVTTAIVMERFDYFQLHQSNAPSDLIIPLWDMVAFGTTFALAAYWRKKPEYHRRLMLMASCMLTAAAFGRFPPNILRPEFFYGGVDALILLGVVRDLIVNKRVHVVYSCVLPPVIVGQAIVSYTSFHALAWWVNLLRPVFR